MKSSEQPVAASGPSSVSWGLLMKSLRALCIQLLLFKDPLGFGPNPFVASSCAARKRESPSPTLPSVP